MRLFFFNHDLRAGFMHPAVKAAVVDRLFHEGSQELGGLATGKAGDQADGLLKPSAVHTLTALSRTLDDPLEQALHPSITLTMEEEMDAR